MCWGSWTDMTCSSRSRKFCCCCCIPDKRRGSGRPGVSSLGGPYRTAWRACRVTGDAQFDTKAARRVDLSDKQKEAVRPDADRKSRKIIRRRHHVCVRCVIFPIQRVSLAAERLLSTIKADNGDPDDGRQQASIFLTRPLSPLSLETTSSSLVISRYETNESFSMDGSASVTF